MGLKLGNGVTRGMLGIRMSCKILLTTSLCILYSRGQMLIPVF